MKRDELHGAVDATTREAVVLKDHTNKRRSTMTHHGGLPAASSGDAGQSFNTNRHAWESPSSSWTSAPQYYASPVILQPAVVTAVSTDTYNSWTAAWQQWSGWQGHY